MSQAKVIREEIEEGETCFSAVLIELGNAYLVFLSEGEDHLGTMAVSIPQRPGMVGPPLSSVLLGDHDVTLARLLAERLAAGVKKMALISVYVKTIDERRAGPLLLRLLEKVLKKREA